MSIGIATNVIDIHEDVASSLMETDLIDIKDNSISRNDSSSMLLKLDESDSELHGSIENALPTGAILTIKKQVSISNTDSSDISLNFKEQVNINEDTYDGHCTPVIDVVELENELDVAEDYIRSDEWKDKGKHIFIMSKAGKPIYSRYGDESKLVTDMGVMTAMVSFVEDFDDHLRCMIAGDHKFVFLTREHLILVCVCHTQESPSHLNLILNYMYNQILSILTHSMLNRMFTQRRNYDLRGMLGGSERLLNGIVEFVEEDMCALLGAVQCLVVPTAVRDQVATCIATSAKAKDLVFALLLTRNRLVTLVHMRKHFLHPVDLHLLLNLVRCNESFRQAEQWSPVCLPKFDSSGYLHAHVSYLDDVSCLVLLTVDKTQFFALSERRAKILERLSRQGLLASLEQSAASSDYTVTQTGVSELRYFVYKWRSTAQCTSPKFIAPYQSLSEQQRILGHLFRVHSLLHCPHRPLKLLYQCAPTETFLGWVTSTFELYTVFGPLITKPTVIRAVNKLLKWIKHEEDRIFILNSPTF